MTQENLTKTKKAPQRDGADRYLRTDELKSDLGMRTARGGVVTLTSQGFKFVIGMAATMVLARLLTPQDYGLVGMVVIITGFVSLFKDLGLSSATIQKEDLSLAQISTLFWINIGLSVGIMLLTAALAPLVAWFYGEPRLTRITIAYAAGFLFGGLVVQHEALLRRQMRFTALAIVETIALTVGIAVAVILAWRGAGYWALVVNQLASGLVYAAGIWIACGWRPGVPVRDSGVRQMLVFGGNLTGFTIINYFARNLDNMLIGRFWGSMPLGLYAKAYQLLLLPIDQITPPITSVAVPALSRLAGAPERYRQAYLRILEKLALFTMPFMALMIATSDWVVQVVLGPNWAGVSRLFALLGIAGLFQPIASTTGWLFVSQGRTHHMFQWGLIGGTITILAIIAGLPWGATGVALSYSIVWVCVIMPVLFWFVGRSGPVRTLDFYRTMAPAACAAVCVLGALLLFRRWAGVNSPLAGLIIAGGIASVITLLVMLVLPSGRKALADLRHLTASLMKRRQIGIVT
ncbi:MAG: lipopolysaccharide biosynthesis protein [Acidobacteria bacterium]|nr:lipopolysaccharide biosynthesis protein [Acidobacteriota bacterium]